MSSDGKSKSHDLIPQCSSLVTASPFKAPKACNATSSGKYVFDLVISNGVLHHTSDPELAFATIANLVKPNGYVMIGLYHRYGRLITDLRRILLALSRDRLAFLDPNLRQGSFGSEKRRAWLADQYKHPHESKHTMGEVLRWFDEAGFRFVKSVPRSRPFRPISPDENLFEQEEPGNALERLMVELGMIATGSREGGFFVMLGQRIADH